MSKKTTIVLLAVAAVFAVTGTAMAVPGTPNFNVPDAGSSAALLAIAAAGIAGARRVFGK